MRQDGEVTYWVVLAQWRDKKTRAKPTASAEWFFHNDCTVHMLNGKGGRVKWAYRMPNENWNPTACGTCWQRYGDFGVMKEEAGIRWLNYVRAKHLEKVRSGKTEKKLACEFRLFKRTKSMQTEEVMI